MKKTKKGEVAHTATAEICAMERRLQRFGDRMDLRVNRDGTLS
jgi:hypothetical protein